MTAWAGFVPTCAAGGVYGLIFLLAVLKLIKELLPRFYFADHGSWQKPQLRSLVKYLFFSFRMFIRILDCEKIELQFIVEFPESAISAHVAMAVLLERLANWISPEVFCFYLKKRTEGNLARKKELTISFSPATNC